MEFARRHGLPLHEVDTGYVVHCHLAELFGELAPTPFSLAGRPGRTLAVLAYSGTSRAKLHDHAQAFADPSVYAACDFARLDEKPMPTEWATGRRLAFESRVCPIVRMGSEGPHHRKGAEVDAFVARCRVAGPDAVVDRATVYRDWIEREFERDGAARLVRVQLAGFQLDRVVRRRAHPSRTARAFDRPAAVMRGAIEVANSAAFAYLLRRGLGRHRAFGFGMLLLRPADTTTC